MNDAIPSSPQRRHFLAGALQGLAAAALPLDVFAQEPANLRATKFIIASSPGTGPDTMARLIQPELQARWKRGVVVENKPGAGGVIGIDAVAKAPADGSTLMIQTSTMFLLPNFYKPLPYDTIKSFTPITQVARSTFALVVNDKVPAHNLGELVDWARTKGSSVNYATPGKGTENHLFMELLKQRKQLQMTHVPYRGTATAIQDLMGNQVSLMFLPIATANVQAKSGRIKIIGCTSGERLSIFPNIPTLEEQGLDGFDFSNWYGVWGPAGMTANAVDQLNQDLHFALTQHGMADKFAEQGWIVKVGTPAELATLGQNQLRIWHDVVTATKVEVD